MIFANELKPPLDEALEHYGVKGMKWGVRRSQAALDRAAGRRAKADNIKRARRETREQLNKRNVAAVKSVTARTPQARGKARAEFSRVQAEYLKNPDRATRQLMTSGEQAVVLVLGGGIPGMAAVVGQTAYAQAVDRSVKRRNS